ncbi:MAG: hypothetical protein B6D72_08065 [gamma proteobacterium symbiont of Ctena orbiculata]|uniref:DUF2796 domain-containing protein n=1 Tax=Candidatus Thiodiazotropha taylori TaxID=2792791 RepID=A0A944QUR8_9GAMM|nr:DUF2796 domain-containing protein [Candidatus Thiodiazotropha taylori]PUB87230.1 MAG: DUF2796 domain-containing protein [gamma proteobacterium symbiont of Ctena orbiculata]MBT2989239.1 DUF2796 domain-containing protein [Candidatus Thiodiazotropha taylori]MBT2995550.1 DUF2796 domain-containing protein [Candidatus Thiodiazotropha taylori]MBT2999496.1 DUF2796 domain-containing protein [Candidatus Thiodiazotropha taylori]
MIKTNFITGFLAICLVVCSTLLHAAGSDSEQHEAHVHGEALLLIAIEGDALEIEFISPAMNLVGFEHQPANAQQEQAVEAAIGSLRQPDLVFSIPSAAKCVPVSIEVESPLAEHGDHHDHEGEAHTDFTAHYRFRCSAISYLEMIDVKLFKQFPGTEVIEVQSISKRGQQKIDLTPGQSRLEL